MLDVKAALKKIIDSGASDLHLKVPSPPLMRLHGKLKPIEGFDPLTSTDTDAALDELLASEEKRREFEKEGEADFSYEFVESSRFRINAFRQRGSTSIVCRSIPMEVPTVKELGLPNVIEQLAEEERGIILCTGTTGSGKSTTMAAMIAHMNEKFAKHIVSIEDPIEYVHSDIKCVINQREVGLDTTSFRRALRRVLRQDPDVIMIGEMRDEETVRTALTAAETGHLVMSTLHTIDAVETVNRIVDFFPPHKQQQSRIMLAGTLKGVISQRLVPTVDGIGRVAACEILTMTGRVHDLILRPEETSKLIDVIAEGTYYGMQTFDQALLGLYKDSRISLDEAMRASSRPHDFKLMIESEGKRASAV